MAAGDSKIDIRNVVRANRRTYIDANTNKARWSDFILIDGVPIVVFVLSIVAGVRLTNQAAIGMLTASGILSALLFGVMLQVSDRAMSWAESDPPRGPTTSARAIFLEELAANAGYAAIVSIVAAITYLSLSISSDWASNHVWPTKLGSALGLALGAHLVLVLLMVIKRVFALTQSELTKARTGNRGGGSMKKVS